MGRIGIINDEIKVLRFSCRRKFAFFCDKKACSVFIILRFTPFVMTMAHSSLPHINPINIKFIVVPNIKFGRYNFGKSC